MSSRKTSSTTTESSSSKILVSQCNYQCCGGSQAKKNVSVVCCKHGRPCARASPVKHAQRIKEANAVNSQSCVAAEGRDDCPDDDNDEDDDASSPSFPPITSQVIPEFNSTAQANHVIIKKFIKSKHKKQSYFANAPSIPISPTIIENESPLPSVKSIVSLIPHVEKLKKQQ